MNEAARQQAHKNLYYLFQMDQAKHPMPEEKQRALFDRIQGQIRLKTKGESE